MSKDSRRQAMSDQHMQEDRTGSSDHPQHRAGPDEGNRAPRVTKESGVAQHSIFDGAGNEVVVVTTTNETTGQRKQGTGANAEEAMESAQSTKEPIGEGYGTAGGH